MDPLPYRCTISMEKDGAWEVHTLTIKDVVLEDAGAFEVTASNRVGKAAQQGGLVVVTEPPVFPKPLQVNKEEMAKKTMPQFGRISYRIESTTDFKVD